MKNNKHVNIAAPQLRSGGKGCKIAFNSAHSSLLTDLVELLDVLDELVVLGLGLDVVGAGQHVLLGRLGVLQLPLVELGQLIHRLLLRQVARRH